MAHQLTCVFRDMTGLTAAMNAVTKIPGGRCKSFIEVPDETEVTHIHTGVMERKVRKQEGQTHGEYIFEFLRQGEASTKDVREAMESAGRNPDSTDSTLVALVKRGMIRKLSNGNWKLI